MMKQIGEARFIGIDIGGTKIELCKFDESYNVVYQARFDTNNFPVNSMDFVESVKTIIRENLNDDVRKIGVSFNCVVKSGCVVRSSLLGGEVSYRLEEDFIRTFNILVRLCNDVNAMATAERFYGKAKNAESFVLLNFGTGIRISSFQGDRLLVGFNGSAGEISRRKVASPLFLDKETILDDVVSGSGISNIYHKMTGRKRTAENIFSSYHEDADAKKSVECFSQQLASVFADVSYFLNPEILILNGSLKKSAHLFLPQALEIHKQSTHQIFHFNEVPVFIDGRKYSSDEVLKRIDGCARPLVYVDACTHRNEKVGSKIIDALVDVPLSKGTLLVNIANPEAFVKNVRFIDRDLNRVFPGSENGGYEERRAFELLPIIKEADVVIDIHSTESGVDSSVIVENLSEGVILLIHAIQPRRVLVMSATKGTALISAAKVGIAFEYGKDAERKTFDDTLRDIRIVLKSMEMINVPVKRRHGKTEGYRIVGSVEKPEGFTVESSIHNFHIVKKGCVIGRKGQDTVIADRDFYPVLFGNNTYQTIFGFMGEKIDL